MNCDAVFTIFLKELSYNILIQRLIFFAENILKNLIAESYPHSVNKIISNNKGCLFINGRLLMSTPIAIAGNEEIGISDNTIVYARLLRKNCLSVTPEKFLDKDFIDELKKKFKVKKVNARLIQYPWI